jgi:Tfp pilus assembly protein PilZ
MCPDESGNKLLAGFSERNPVLLLATSDMPVRLVQVMGRSIEIRTPDAIVPDEKIRLRFENFGEHPGRIQAMVQVDSVADDNRQFSLSFLAFHSQEGRSCLEEFIESFLFLSPEHIQEYKAGADGTFCILTRDSESPAKCLTQPSTSISSRAQSEADKPERVEVRVPVRTRVAFQFAGQMQPGEAYNISNSGLFITTHEKLPSNGSSVTVFYPVRDGVDLTRISLEGVVCWSSASMASATGGGFGVHFTRIDDQRNGALWREHVDEELAFV